MMCHHCHLEMLKPSCTERKLMIISWLLQLNQLPGGCSFCQHYCLHFPLYAEPLLQNESERTKETHTEMHGVWLPMLDFSNLLTLMVPGISMRLPRILTHC